MGVRLLNTFLTNKTKSSLNKIHLSKLSGKTIAVDTSIYLYRFIGENALIENLFIMCSLFKKYNIHPIFVFDGKPPKEKEDELKKRSCEKQEAQDEYKTLQILYNETNNVEEKLKLEKKMKELKKSFIRIKNSEVRKVKDFFQSYGMTYIDCNGEADQICAYLCKVNKAYACLTEDMDQFIYGTKKILRYLSLLKDTVVVYDTESIYKELNISKHNFKKMCILSGTDYSSNHSNLNTNIFKLYDLIQHYEDDFNKVIDRLVEDNNDKGKYSVESIQENISNILDIYSKYGKTCVKYKNINIHNGYIHKENLHKILKEDNFIIL